MDGWKITLYNLTVIKWRCKKRMPTMDPDNEIIAHVSHTFSRNKVQTDPAPPACIFWDFYPPLRVKDWVFCTSRRSPLFCGPRLEKAPLDEDLSRWTAVSKAHLSALARRHGLIANHYHHFGRQHACQQVGKLFNSA